MNKMLNMLEYFMHNKWNWSRQNVDMLNKMLSANDKQVNLLGKICLKIIEKINCTGFDEFYQLILIRIDQIGLLFKIC